MTQIVEALCETALRLGQEYGPRVALGVAAALAAGLGGRIVYRLLVRGSR